MWGVKGSPREDSTSPEDGGRGLGARYAGGRDAPAAGRVRRRRRPAPGRQTGSAVAPVVPDAASERRVSMSTCAML